MYYIKPIKRSEHYQNFVDSTIALEYQDFSPITVDNVFSEEQIDHIYEVINKQTFNNIRLGNWGGQASWFNTEFDKSIYDTAEKIMKDNFGDLLVINGDCSFARYSEEYNAKPKLFPHADLRKTPRVLLDIQLNADVPWDLVVEETNYPLKNNQGLIFHGTNQIHWREKKYIGPHARVDMLFMNFEFKDGREFISDHLNITDKRSMYLREFYKLDSTPEPIEERKYGGF